MGRSRKKPRPILHRIEYAGVLGFLLLFRFLPEPAAQALALGFARIFSIAVPKRRAIARRNLQRAFGGDKSPEAVQSLVDACYRNLALSAVELIRFAAMERKQVEERFRVEGAEFYEKAEAEGRGVIVIGAHFGNWELPNIAHALRYSTPYIVARRLDNPFLDRLVAEFRERFGSRIINTRQKGAILEIMRGLKKGGSVGFLIDQNVVGDRGVFVDFFGRLAYTHKVIALLALRTGSPVVSMFASREKDGTHRIEYGEPVRMISTGDHERDLVLNTQRMTRVIENQIRKVPDQWFWIHDRWKKRPVAGTIRMEERAVFLDRDGTVTEEVGYVDDLSKFRLMEGSAEAVRLLNRRGIKTIVVTNQSGVARGYYPESQVQQVNRRLEEMMTAEDARLDAIYYCPHHPTEGRGDYTLACDCRKPGPGMLYRAEADHGVRLSQSFVVGDKVTDMELARRVGAVGIHVMTGYGAEELRRGRSEGRPEPDHVAENLFSAVRWILERLEEPQTT